MNQWVADNELMVSKHADKLEHVDTGRKISSDPKTWVCEDSGKTENLWLNLSTGVSTQPEQIARFLSLDFPPCCLCVCMCGWAGVPSHVLL